MTNQPAQATQPPAPETFSGVLHTAPDMRYTPNGKAVTLIHLAPDGSPVGYRAIGWDRIAEEMNQKLDPGDRIWVRAEWGTSTHKETGEVYWQAKITAFRLVTKGTPAGRPTVEAEPQAPPAPASPSAPAQPPQRAMVQAGAPGTSQIMRPPDAGTIVETDEGVSVYKDQLRPRTWGIVQAQTVAKHDYLRQGEWWCPATDDMEETLDLIVLRVIQTRTMWGDFSESNIPYCSSNDGVRAAPGMALGPIYNSGGDESSPAQVCVQCEHFNNQPWLLGEGADRKQVCTPSFSLLCLEYPELTPCILRAHGTHYQAWQGLANSKGVVRNFVVRVGTKKRSNPKGTWYTPSPQLRFQALTEEEKQDVMEMYGLFGRATVTAYETAEERGEEEPEQAPPATQTPPPAATVQAAPAKPAAPKQAPLTPAQPAAPPRSRRARTTAEPAAPEPPAREEAPSEKQELPF